MLLARYTNWNRPCSALWRRLRLQRVKMRNDAIDMEVNEGLLAFGTEEEGAVGGVVHEEVFGEDGGAGGVAEEVEVGFLVGVGVGVVGAEAVAGEVDLGGGVEGGGERAGSGADTIKKGWADNKWPAPEIKEHFGQNDDQVELTLRIGQSTSSPGKGTENTENQGKTRVKTREIIGRNPKVTIPEMAKEIGVAPKTIEWHIAKMKGVEIDREGPANGGH